MRRRLGSVMLFRRVVAWRLERGRRSRLPPESSVRSSTGTKGAMPGATVTVINTGTNAQRVVNTDGEGRFSIPNLPPAIYTVRVELSGFATTEIKD